MSGISGSSFSAGNNQIVVAGDNFGTAHATGFHVPAEIVPSIALVAEALRAVDVPTAVRTRAEQHLAAVERAMVAGQPDRARAAGSLAKVVDVLKEGDALLKTGTSLAEGIGKIIRWIGPLAIALVAPLLGV